MSVVIAASAVRTCLGDGAETFAAMRRGRSGVAPLRYFDASTLNVSHGYQIVEEADEPVFRASRWLTVCVRQAVERCGLDLTRRRVAAIVGTGLRELRAVELDGAPSDPLEAARLHFGAAVRRALPQLAEVITISNACSASGHALAVAQDLLALDEFDVVIAAGADAMTASMLAMIGRFAEAPTSAIRPFDRSRTGALLGDGAAAVVVVRDTEPVVALARVLSTGLSCDAAHETVPSREGILRAMRDAFERARRRPENVDLVVAHGTGTLLNDPTESAALAEMFGAVATPPLVTGLKGAIGHTSGSAALMSVDVAVRCMTSGTIPPVVGLREPLDEGRTLRLVTTQAASAPVRLAQVNAFGFGGVNAVTLLERAA
ncbi:MAG TPA: beta-ketoacyl synthase N-terminal-like domain-containing protein [Micromonosporaceae bacterium]|jgi:3-oxoacyl-[acyl-carrier-protein] synthase II